MSRELHRAMRVFEIPVGSTGSVFVATCKSNGAAIDLSGATGNLYYNAKTVDGAAVVTDGVAAFTTDGTDGKVQFPLTLLAGSVRDLLVDLEVQGYNGGNLVAFTFKLRFTPRAKGV